jgi:tetratricopeptide (TPR) repeat protein
VNYVLEGSVRAVDDGWLVTSHLITAAEGASLWSRSYTYTSLEDLAVQRSLAKRIAHVVTNFISLDRYSTMFGLFRTLSFFDYFEAIDQLFLGLEQYVLLQIGEGGDWTVVEQHYQNAVRANPDYTMGHVMLAGLYTNIYKEEIPIGKAQAAAHAAIDKAHSLDPDDPSVLFQRAQIYLNLDLDHVRAEQDFQQVLRLTPNMPGPHMFFASIAIREGRKRAAIDHLSTLTTNNEGSEKGLRTFVAAALFRIVREYEHALALTDQALVLFPVGKLRVATLLQKTTLMIRFGQKDAARPFLDEAWILGGASRPEAYIATFAAIGDIERAKELIAQLPDNHSSPGGVAVAHIILEEFDDAFRLLERAIEEQDMYVISTLRLAEEWDPIRSDPRFDHLIDRCFTPGEDRIQDLPAAAAELGRIGHDWKRYIRNVCRQVIPLFL